MYMKIRVVGDVLDVITYAKFQNEIFRGYNFTGVEFSIFPIDFEWALQQCSATALPVIGRWLMHDGMQYDPIQNQCQGPSPWKSEIRPFSKAISSPIYNGGWQVTGDLKLGHNTYSLSGPDYFVLVFVSGDFEVGSK